MDSVVEHCRLHMCTEGRDGCRHGRGTEAGGQQVRQLGGVMVFGLHLMAIPSERPCFEMSNCRRQGSSNGRTRLVDIAGTAHLGQLK